MNVACTAHIIILDLINLIIFDTNYEAVHHATFSGLQLLLLVAQILPSPPCSQTLFNLCSSLDVRDQVSQKVKK
jgi:hypothetical protein